jgi:hypothetical protein
MTTNIRYSRADIVYLGIIEGLTFDEATALAHYLSPECQTVPARKVERHIEEMVKNA